MCSSAIMHSPVLGGIIMSRSIMKIPGILLMPALDHFFSSLIDFLPPSPLIAILNTKELS
ncbi:hypothetical protein EST38_g756 [Candolleomyces aberdarensis]|uniref:Uncharacterized protein n=1 Tax=Candolleomyces aberdarensis TaxID=2316362 RepID=A0A4Q2DXU0_9AGAR|nr:hypothetical protein EST38_g756 [Candolleomyces aberdarensis]